MDDLKVQQAMGAVEGQLRVLVDEAEAQGRVAGAAAEAERIWQLGRAILAEWKTGATATGGAAPFLAELRTRAVPGLEAAAPVEAHPVLVLPSEDPRLLAMLAAHQEQLREETEVAKGQQDHAGTSAGVPPVYDGSQDAPAFYGGRGLQEPLPEPVKPFDNSGAEDVQTSKL